MIETHVKLRGRQREMFGKVVARKEYAKMQDTELTWGDRLRLEGREEGGVSIVRAWRSERPLS